MNQQDLAERLGPNGPRLALFFAAVLTIAVASAACDRRLAPYVPLEEEPPPAEGPIRIPGLEAPSPRARVMAPPVTSAVLVRGTLQIADGTELPPGGVLFIMARAETGGPPVAVRRLDPGPFPMQFVLGRGDSMLGDQPLPGMVLLSVRLDRDGDPMTREAGDLVAESSGPVEIPLSGVELVLAPRGIR